MKVHGILRVLEEILGIKKCKGKWILEIDADERVQMTLKMKF